MKIKELRKVFKDQRSTIVNVETNEILGKENYGLQTIKDLEECEIVELVVDTRQMRFEDSKSFEIAPLLIIKIRL